MSILAQLNMDTGKWTWKVAPESPAPDVEIGFVNSIGVVTFDNLSFGLIAEVDGGVAFENSYPVEGFTYISTDQKYVTCDRVNLHYDDEVVLKVWAENAGVRYEDSTSFTIPRPPALFPSWVWNGNWWEPPIPYPDDQDNEYYWDEENQGWVLVEPDGES